MDRQTILGGKAELAIGATLIPPELLSSIKPNFEEGERESKSLAGVRKQPSGTFETAELTFTLLVPSMDYLKILWNDAYTAKSGTGKSGNVIFGTASCQTRQTLPINIHYVCDGKDDSNDIHIYAGIVKMKWDAEYNESDDLSVEVSVFAQPTEHGYVRFGTGDVSQPSYYDVTTQTTKPATSSH